MTRFESRFREALRVVAEEVPAGGVPPLSLPSGENNRLQGPDSAAEWPDSPDAGYQSFRWQARWLAPAAAGAAVLAIAAAVAIAGSSHPGPSPRTSHPVKPSVFATSLGRSVLTGACGLGTASPARTSGVPAYYIAQTATAQPYAQSSSIAGIYSTASGALCAKLELPAGQTVVRVSAAADDRTFAIAVSAFPNGGNPGERFYLLHFDPARGIDVRGLATPQVPQGATFDAVALSPSGDKLAVAFEPVGGNGGPSGKLSETLRVLNIRTGFVRTWIGRPGSVAGDTANPWPLSWAADDRTLAINWIGASPASQDLQPTSGLRLLDTSKPGHLLVPESRLVIPLRTGANGNQAISVGNLSDIALITPDGETVVAAVDAFTGPDGGFAELSARTGQLERRLDWRPVDAGRGAPMTVLWASASGQTLVVYAPPGHPARIGILRGNALTLLGADQAAQFPDAAW